MKQMIKHAFFQLLNASAQGSTIGLAIWAWLKLTAIFGQPTINHGAFLKAECLQSHALAQLNQLTEIIFGVTTHIFVKVKARIHYSNIIVKKGMLFLSKQLQYS